MAAVRRLWFEMSVWTTHEVRLLVFITVQNVVVIDAVALIICRFFCFHGFGLKTLIRAPKFAVWGDLTPWWAAISTNPPPKKKGTSSSAKTYRLSKSVHRCDLCAWRRDKKRKKERQRKKPNGGKLGICQHHPRHEIEMKFCVLDVLEEVVLRFKFHQNRLSGIGAVGVEICPFPFACRCIIQSLYYSS